MSPYAFFYHWTHATNIGSILACGLDPEYAEGRMPVVWMCEADRTGWALRHISERHAWNPDEMTLIRFPNDGVPYAHTAYNGVFTTNRVIRVYRRCALKAGVLAGWVPAATVRRNMGNSVQKRPCTCTPNPEPSA